MHYKDSQQFIIYLGHCTKDFNCRDEKTIKSWLEQWMCHVCMSSTQQGAFLTQHYK